MALLLIAVALLAMSGVAWQRRAPELPASLRAIVPGMTIATIGRLVGGAPSGDRMCAACTDGHYRMSAHYRVEVPGGLAYGQQRFLLIDTSIGDAEICTGVRVEQVSRIAWPDPWYRLRSLLAPDRG